MSTTKPDPADVWLTSAGTVIVLATLAAYIILTLYGYGDSTTQLLGFITPVVAALLILRKVDNTRTQQQETLAKIERQTNGELDRRIREGVTDALAVHEGHKATEQAQPTR